jgi:predicted small lipoprotein YifL
MRPTLSTVFTLAVLAASLAACGDNSSITAPTSTVATQVAPTSTINSLALTTLSTVNVLKRTNSIADTTVTKVIGAAGGTISIPAAGLSLTVPPLAVSANTTFQVHVLPGSVVAYEFEPHGTTFPVPLVVAQSLVRTSRSQASTAMHADYFTDKSKINFDSNVATVSEELPITFTSNSVITFKVWHFSGYLVSSG